MTRGAETTSPSSTIANWSVGGVAWLATSSRVTSAKALVPSESKSMLTTHSPLRLEELIVADASSMCVPSTGARFEQVLGHPVVLAGRQRQVGVVLEAVGVGRVGAVERGELLRQVRGRRGLLGRVVPRRRRSDRRWLREGRPTRDPVGDGLGLSRGALGGRRARAVRTGGRRARARPNQRAWGTGSRPATRRLPGRPAGSSAARSARPARRCPGRWRRGSTPRSSRSRPGPAC